MQVDLYNGRKMMVVFSGKRMLFVYPRHPLGKASIVTVPSSCVAVYHRLLLFRDCLHFLSTGKFSGELAVCICLLLTNFLICILLNVAEVLSLLCCCCYLSSGQ